MSSPALEVSPPDGSRSGLDGGWAEGRCASSAEWRPKSGVAPSAGEESTKTQTVEPAPFPCQLTDVVTRLSLARCLVTERAPSRDNQSALVFVKSGTSGEPIREKDLAWEGGENLSRRGLLRVARK